MPQAKTANAENASTTWEALTEVYTTKEAARILKVSHRTLEDQRLKGRGPRFIKLGKWVRYREPDLAEWLDSPTFANTAEAVS